MNQRLAWYRWEWPDPQCPEKWTAWTISIYRPTYERPYVSILLSIANGGGRVLMRLSSLSVIAPILPSEAKERLERAVTTAEEYKQEIMRDLRYISERRAMPPGVGLARTDTGEIIAEAEKIIRGE